MLSAVAQKQKDDLKIAENLLPITEANFFKTDGYYNWCPSIIKGKDKQYHLFYSRWPKATTFSGWQVYSEIAHATAPTPMGPWTYKETVLRGRGYGYWDAITAHNPKIKYFNGKYYLYYISTNINKQLSKAELDYLAKASTKVPDRMTLRVSQRTGVAVSSSLNGPWQRLDKPIVEPSGPIQTLTVNPAVVQGKDKRFYMIVKGDKPGGEKYFLRNQALAIADNPEGPFVIQPKPVIDNLDTEDVSMWFDESRDRYYAIFHSTEGFIGLMTSKNGTDWERANEFKIIPKELLQADGKMYKPQSMERPFVYVENGKPLVFSVAVKDGDNSYDLFVPLKKIK